MQCYVLFYIKPSLFEIVFTIDTLMNIFKNKSVIIMHNVTM